MKKKTLNKVSHTNLQNSCPQPVIDFSIFWYFYLILRLPYVSDFLSASLYDPGGCSAQHNLLQPCPSAALCAYSRARTLNPIAFCLNSVGKQGYRSENKYKIF